MDENEGAFEKGMNVIANQMADKISEKILRKLQSMNGSKETENQDGNAALPAMTTAIQMKGGKPKSRKLRMKITKSKKPTKKRM